MNGPRQAQHGCVTQKCDRVGLGRVCHVGALRQAMYSTHGRHAAGRKRDCKALIFIGIGSNLGGGRFAAPRDVCEAALRALDDAGVRVLRRSRWYESAPVPVSDQPWFVNGVAEVASDLPPEGLLDILHRVEAAFGRTRRVVNEARVLDLDLLDHHGLVRPAGPELPHPRLHVRGFVLLPLAELAPGWRHPATGQRIGDLIAGLDPGQTIRPIPAD